jgi:hypothetical protein
MDFGGEGVKEDELPATRAGGSLAKFLTKRQYLDGEMPSSFTPKSPGSVLPEVGATYRIAELAPGDRATRNAPAKSGDPHGQP